MCRELIGARNAAGFHTGRKIARIMPAKTAAAHGAHQVLQRFEAEKIDGLVSNFKARFGLAVLRLAQAARAVF